MFMIFRVGRDVTRVAARAGNQQRKPSQPRQPSGVPWFSVILAGILCAWVMEGLEHHMGRGAAFLIVFPLWFVLTVIFAAVGLAMKGGGSKSSPSAEIRAAHAEQERAKRDRARSSLPAEMEAADKEARAWKAAHPEMFAKSSNERTGR